MKRSIVYAVILAAALLLPTDAVELGKMIPVETVSIRYEEDRLIIETDTENMGAGATINEALVDLQRTAPGEICLETAQYLLVEESALDLIPKLAGILKGGVRICLSEGETDVKSVGKYLRHHTPVLKLKDWCEDARLQVLVSTKGRQELK